MYRKIFLISLFLALFAFGCKNEQKKEQEIIDNYLIQNNITAQPTSTGLYYIETIKGTGLKATYGKLAKIKYICTLLDGTFIDSCSYSSAFTFNIGYGQVISGFDEGVSYMNVGGKATLIIPSWIAYGKTGNGAVPPYAPLIYKIELLNLL